MARQGYNSFLTQRGIMDIEVQGVINGKYIELDWEPGLPSGTAVLVRIHAKSPSLEEQRHLVDALCGAWAGDPGLAPIFSETEQQRAITMPREADWHVAP